MNLEVSFWIRKAGSGSTYYGQLQAPIIVLGSYSTGPQILDEVETFEERCSDHNFGCSQDAGRP